jgi:hypothetical protein
MNFLGTGKRPVYLALFLIITLAGFSRWNSSTNSGNTNFIPSSHDPNQTNHSFNPDIPRTAKDQTPAADLLTQASTDIQTAVTDRTAAGASSPKALLQETAQPLPATAEAMTLALTPTLSIPAQPISQTASDTANLPSISEFTQQVSDGQADQVRGIYVSRVMALHIVPQPQGDPSFISAEEGTATLFQTASFFGVTGLLAHNFLSGRDFFHLTSGQEINVIYGDGHLRNYRVSQIDDFQRLSINDLRSNFMELSSGLQKTADQVFADFYQGSPHLTLQTCIERDGEWSWGVRFIKADPLD